MKNILPIALVGGSLLLIIGFIAVSTLKENEKTEGKNTLLSDVALYDKDGNLLGYLNSNKPKTFAVINNVPNVKYLQFTIKINNTGELPFTVELLDAQPAAMKSGFIDFAKTEVPAKKSTIWVSKLIDINPLTGQTVQFLIKIKEHVICPTGFECKLDDGTLIKNGEEKDIIKEDKITLDILYDQTKASSSVSLVQGALIPEVQQPICTNQCTTGQTKCSNDTKSIQNCITPSTSACTSWGGDILCASNTICSSPSVTCKLIAGETCSSSTDCLSEVCTSSTSKTEVLIKSYVGYSGIFGSYTCPPQTLTCPSSGYSYCIFRKQQGTGSISESTLSPGGSTSGSSGSSQPYTKCDLYGILETTTQKCQ